MNKQEQQIINGLFQHLQSAEANSGPRDPAAERLLTAHLQRQPAAPYYMAQTILAQQAALKKAQSQLQATGRSGSPQQKSGSGGTGFLGGAAQTALGVAGGVVAADFAIDLLDEIEYGDVADDLVLGEAYDAGAEDLLGDADDLFDFDDF